jgi:hypothetical protein
MRRMLPIAFFAVLVFITAPRCAAQDHAESSRKLVARAEPSYPGIGGRPTLHHEIDFRSWWAPRARSIRHGRGPKMQMGSRPARDQRSGHPQLPS